MKNTSILFGHSVRVLSGLTILFMLMPGCSSSSTGPNTTGGTTANVTATTDLLNPTLQATRSKSASPASGTTVQSIRITHVRVLIGSMFFGSLVDTSTVTVDTFTVGSRIADFTPGNTGQFSSLSIPPGIFNQISFNLHQLDASESGHLSDPAFADFATADRPSVIIEGQLTDNSGMTQNFIYKTSNTQRVITPIQPMADMLAGHSYTVDVRLDAKNVFEGSTSKPLDPRDAGNKAALDSQIGYAFSVAQK